MENFFTQTSIKSKIDMKSLPGGYYGMIEARVVVSFQHILNPVFGSDLASVLSNLTNPQKW